ncbi:MAG TPA: STAS domain-containing protein [Actinomycetes bacterium]
MISLLDPRHVGRHTVVELTGEVDIATAAGLRDCLLALVNRGADSLVVDLRGVTFIDSTGVGTLLRIFHRQSLLGGSVHFLADQPAVLRVFDLMQLTRRLHVAATIDDVDLCCPVQAATAEPSRSLAR